MPQLVLRLYLDRVGKPAAAVQARVHDAISLHLHHVEEALSRTGHFAGRELSAADIQMSVPLQIARMQGLLGEHRPAIAEFLARCEQRPAYRKAIDRGGPYALAS